MIDKELLEQFQLLTEMMGKMATKEDLADLKSRMITTDDIELFTDRGANRAVALIEEKLGMRINGLFDGYKLPHEKQWKLERHVETLEQIMSALQSQKV